jgi:hypothetical protein
MMSGPAKKVVYTVNVETPSNLSGQKVTVADLRESFSAAGQSELHFQALALL